jgi:cysteine desulfurase
MPIFPRKTYLDHNATTPLAPEVRKAMAACLKKTHGNPSSLHTVGRRARGVVDQARKSVAALLDCAPEHIFFTSGGTEANNTVIKGVFQAAGGGHIITSGIEHDSILGACSQVEELGGHVTYLMAGTDGRVSANDVRDAIRPDTILISIMHGNNETGAIQPIGEISSVAKEAGVPLHTDAVQTFGKISTRVDELGVEFLSLSGHKINGPKGVGALYWRGNVAWMPLLCGGHQEHKMRTGTEAVHQICGLGVAAELAAKRMRSEHERLEQLRDALLSRLCDVYPDVQVNECPAEQQLPGTVSAAFPGKSGIHILAGLDCYEVCVSIGSACTADKIEPSHVLLGMGRSEKEALSTIRISMGTTTSLGDVKYLPRALGDVLENEPPGFGWLDPQHLTAERIRSEKTFMIDIRYPYERMLEPSVPGAKLWSYIGFDRYIKRVPKDRDVIIMCGTGIMSFSSGYRLAKSGHPSVFVVYGGYAAWRAVHPELIKNW